MQLPGSSSWAKAGLISIICATQLHLISGATIPSLPRNVTSNDSPEKYCTDSSAWIGSGAESTDCIGAVQHFYNTEVDYWQDQDFEFISPKVPPRGIPAMGTPRKYTMRTCTVAIVMLNFFADGELPGGVEGPFASRDVSSFFELWQAVTEIEKSCLVMGRPGWAVEGGRGALGIFLWATASPENQRVPPGVPIPGYLLNSSTSATTANLSIGSGEVFANIESA